MQTKLLTAFALASLMTLAFTEAPAFAGRAARIESPKAVELREALRDLWVGHIFWVRSVVVSSRYGDAEAAKVAEANAVENAKAIANSMVAFYGESAGKRLFDLLAGHYGAVKEYMSAAYAMDTGAKDAATKKIVANAEEIAGFLSSANPNWPKATLLSLLSAHGAHHMQQIDAIKEKNYSSEAETWTVMKRHMYTIADALAAGIVKQFPGKFRR